ERLPRLRLRRAPVGGDGRLPGDRPPGRAAPDHPGLAARRRPAPAGGPRAGRSGPPDRPAPAAGRPPGGRPPAGPRPHPPRHAPPAGGAGRQPPVGPEPGLSRLPVRSVGQTGLLSPRATRAGAPPDWRAPAIVRDVFPLREATSAAGSAA